jgi:hypothetical protein
MNCDVKPDIYIGHLTAVEKFLDIPNLRQSGDYTGGTTCAQTLMNYHYRNDDKNLLT